jgi:hypothetical protein
MLSLRMCGFFALVWLVYLEPLLVSAVPHSPSVASAARSEIERVLEEERDMLEARDWEQSVPGTGAASALSAPCRACATSM